MRVLRNELVTGTAQRPGEPAPGPWRYFSSATIVFTEALTPGETSTSTM
jgi:hypothetical protein